MPASPFEVIEQRNRKLAELLETNHSISQYFMGVLDGIMNFCKDKNAKFEDVRIEDPFIIDHGDSAYVRGRISVV